jgi:hypothetical protein
MTKGEAMIYLGTGILNSSCSPDAIMNYKLQSLPLNGTCIVGGMKESVSQTDYADFNFLAFGHYFKSWA